MRWDSTLHLGVLLAWAAATKDPRLGSLHGRIDLLTVLEATSPRSRCWKVMLHGI